MPMGPQVQWQNIWCIGKYKQPGTHVIPLFQIKEVKEKMHQICTLEENARDILRTYLYNLLCSMSVYIVAWGTITANWDNYIGQL